MGNVNTIHGEMDEALLTKKETREEDDDKITEAIEYWKDGELVHRSVNMKLKRWPEGMEGVGQALFDK